MAAAGTRTTPPANATSSGDARFAWSTAEEKNLVAQSDSEIWRVGGSAKSWLEWWQERLFLSAPSESAGRRILEAWHNHPLFREVPVRSVFFRELVRNPRPGQIPTVWSGRADDGEFVIRENGLRYAVHLLDGYSPGLFPDQRANRTFLREKLASCGRGARVLNTFAYTGAFSVTAAAAGAETLTVDLSKRYLEQARENFTLNGLDHTEHRWISDDTLAFLPRLQRRGEKFDFIILDPPTFSRNRDGRVFRAEKDYPHLLQLAEAVAAPGAWILLSTNCRSIDPDLLGAWTRSLAPHAGLIPGRHPADFLRGPCPSTLWVNLP